MRICSKVRSVKVILHEYRNGILGLKGLENCVGIYIQEFKTCRNVEVLDTFFYKI